MLLFYISTPQLIHIYNTCFRLQPTLDPTYRELVFSTFLFHIPRLY